MFVTDTFFDPHSISSLAETKSERSENAFRDPFKNQSNSQMLNLGCRVSPCGSWASSTAGGCCWWAARGPVHTTAPDSLCCGHQPPPHPQRQPGDEGRVHTVSHSPSCHHKPIRLFDASLKQMKTLLMQPERFVDLHWMCIPPQTKHCRSNPNKSTFTLFDEQILIFHRNMNIDQYKSTDRINRSLTVRLKSELFLCEWKP